jgi:hypothetical protein
MRRADQRVLIIKLIFVGVFAVLCAGVWWYQLSVVKPRTACLSQPGATWFPKTKTCQVPPGAACEATGNWWDPVSKTCAHVVYVPNITGRRP